MSERLFIIWSNERVVGQLEERHIGSFRRRIGMDSATSGSYSVTFPCNPGTS